MKILAILQNQWFKNPKLMEKIYERHGGGLDGRAELNAVYLFFRCLTGKRLKSALGNELCDQIVWENASAGMGGESSAKLEADPAHIFAIIRHHQPQIVITFGSVAANGLQETLRQWPQLTGGQKTGFEIMACCHPASRHGAVTLLNEFAARLRESINRLERAA